MRKNAFTLIELMISVALGTLIVYIALSGVRVASQAIALSNKMALDNAIMRTGMQIALDYTDFWTNHDDPFATNTRDQYLRVTAPDRSSPVRIMRGQAFTPFSLSASSTGYGAANPTPSTASVLNEGRNEGTRGWDPNAWHAAAQRTWCLTPMFENPIANGAVTPLNQMQGRYFLISAPESTGIPSPSHPWQARQANGLLLSLGIYGALDYLPANTPLIAYSPRNNPANDESAWGIDDEWAGAAGSAFREYVIGGRYGFNRCGGGRYGATLIGGYSIPNRGVPIANLTHVNNRNYYLTVSGIGSHHLNNLFASQGYKQMMLDSEYTDSVLNDNESGLPNNKPEHWPAMEVKVLRFMREGAFINLNRVIMTDSLTGNTIQLSFTAFGTTLRGARQQRAPGQAGTPAGWADPFSNSPLKNLDSP